MRQRRLLVSAAPLAVLLSGCTYVLQPPARYDYPFPGTLEVRSVEQMQAAELCRFPHRVPWRAGVGCAIIEEDRCLILLTDKATAEVLRHEIAHCNGWTGEHED